MKAWGVYIAMCLLVVVSAGLIEPPKTVDESSMRVAAYLKEAGVGFISSAKQLEASVSQLDSGSIALVQKARQALLLCRLQYKRISFLLDYFFASESAVFNAPPKYEVDEPDMEYQHPAGLQVIEGLLYSNDVQANKTAMLAQAQLVERSAEELPALLYGFKATGAQVLESAKLELIRVMALYITGYDAPQLKSGIEESSAALTAMQGILAPYMANYQEKDSIGYYLQSSIQYLNASKGFDQFDRLCFLTAFALPLQRQLVRMGNVLNFAVNTVPALNSASQNLFNPYALNKNAFAAGSLTDTALATLGRQLFFEPALSGNRGRSCGSCHIPSKYFQDGLPRNTALDGKASLPRNTTSLLYSSYQYSQFWDGRAKNLNEQAAIVLHNKTEMDGRDDSIINRLQSSAKYMASFKALWPGQQVAVNLQNITTAISAYIKTLSPFNSPFDRYMQGDTTALTARQKQGFNIFMGKAACGTCHFAPLFNGLTPPLYNKTEYEVAGTTLTDDFNKPVADKDSGRYDFFPIQFYIKAFKTPTVRNAAVTAPYMHNGGFKTLETVVEFYDKGGGAGLGLNETYQTLPSTSLHLTADEKASIVAFLRSLTDDIGGVNK